MHNVHICSFSCAAAELPRGKRNKKGVLGVLPDHPRISTWDMCELAWLRKIIQGLLTKGLIKELKEPYP